MKEPIIYQRVEAGFLFGLALFAYIHSHFRILWFILLLFSVDLFLLGYLVNNSIGAQVYNFGHSFIIPAILMIAGLATGSGIAIGLGLIWLAHIGLDRALGYGFKFSSGFKDTHLGKIGH